MNGLECIKLLVGIGNDDNSLDELLGLLISNCETFVRTYCGIFDVDEKMELCSLPEPLASATLDLAVIRYNKVGSEGLAKEIVGPMTLDYMDIPDGVRCVMDKFKKITF